MSVTIREQYCCYTSPVIENADILTRFAATGDKSMMKLVWQGWGQESEGGGGGGGGSKMKQLKATQKQGDGVKGWRPVQVGAGLSALFVWLSLSTSDKTKLKRFTPRTLWALHFNGELWRPWEPKFSLFSRFLKATICFNEHFFLLHSTGSGRVALSHFFF